MWYFYAAKSEIKLQICEIRDFQYSWLFKHNICYLCDINRESFQLYLNFPTLPELLKADLMHRLEKGINITINEARPFILENSFFDYFEQKSNTWSVYSSFHTGHISFTIHATHHVQDELHSVENGVLYRLRNLHPAIDGIGVFDDIKMAGIHIQVSISAYKSHRSKLNTYLRTYVTKSKVIPSELKQSDFTNIFDHYAHKCKYDHAVYLYTSTGMVYTSSEINKLSVMNKYAKGKFEVGLLTEDVYKFLIRAT